jgi:hypothetical protein
MGVIDQDRRHARLQPDLPSFPFLASYCSVQSDARFSDFQKQKYLLSLYLRLQLVIIKGALWNAFHNCPIATQTPDLSDAQIQLISGHESKKSLEISQPGGLWAYSATACPRKTNDADRVG